MVKLPESKWEDVNTAKTELLTQLDDMIKEIRNFDGNTDTMSDKIRFIKEGAYDWLGMDMDSMKDFKKLANDLEKIQTAIMSKNFDDFKIMPINEHGAMANPLGRKIYLSEYFFSDAISTDIWRQGTLLHEATHFLGVLGTNFLGISGTSGEVEVVGEKEARGKPTRRNAANWEYFYLNYVDRL